jgi:hypothetical protein
VHKVPERELWKCKLYKACHRSKGTVLTKGGIFMATEKSKGNSGYIRERELQILIRLN